MAATILEFFVPPPPLRLLWIGPDMATLFSAATHDPTSIAGVLGLPGADGIQGPQGPPGPKGDDGTNWTLTDW